MNCAARQSPRLLRRSSYRAIDDKFDEMNLDIEQNTQMDPAESTDQKESEVSWAAARENNKMGIKLEVFICNVDR